PLIYASLGTLVNGQSHVYSAILRAVETLPDTQVVLSVGRSVDVDQVGAIPSNVIMVRSAPQIELLKRATLTITHAGLNTALESLAQGVPNGRDPDRVRPAGRCCQDCPSWRGRVRGSPGPGRGPASRADPEGPDELELW